MMNQNTFECIGNVGKVPEVEATKSGTAVLKFSVCENIRIKHGESWETKPQWHYVVAWKDLAENAAMALKPGMLVFIKGVERFHAYTDKNGVERDGRQIFADVIAQVIPPWKGKAKDKGFDGMGTEVTPEEDIPF